MKVVVDIARCLFIICLPVLLFTATISGAVNCTWLYTHGFEKYDVRQSLAEGGLTLDSSQLEDIVAGFIHYFNSGDELIHLTVMQNGEAVELFNYEEILHFKDVKGLFRLNYYLLAGTVVYCLTFALVSIFRRQGKYRLYLAKSTMTGIVLTLGIMIVLGMGFLLDFGDFFLRLHLIAFSNDYWSAEGNMLLFFPQGFWYDTVIYCAITITMIAVVLGGVSWLFLRYRRNKN